MTGKTKIAESLTQFYRIYFEDKITCLGENITVDYGIFEAFLDAVIIVDENKKLIYANHTAGQLMNMPRRAFKKGKVLDDVVSFNPPVWNDKDLKSIKDSTPYRELEFETYSGNQGIVQVTIQPAAQENQWIVVARDVTLEERLQKKYRAELTQKEEVIEALKDREKTLESVNKNLDRKLFEISLLLKISKATSSLQETQDVVSAIIDELLWSFHFEFAGLFVYDKTGKLVLDSVKPRPEQLGDQHEPLPLITLASDIEPAKQALAKRQAIPLAEGRDAFILKKLENVFDHKLSSGFCFPVKTKNTDRGILVLGNPPKSWPSQKEDLNLMLSIVSQIGLTLENAELYERSITDGLTGLYNVKHFRFRLKAELVHSRRNARPVSMLLFDIDHFKKFNDTYGHQTGDRVLENVAAAIQKTIRTGDLAARYGGEEFALILPNTDLDGSLIVAERLRQLIENLRVKGPKNEELKVTISIGTSTFPEHAEVADDLIECADIALYAAKNAGRNRVHMYEPKESSQDVELTDKHDLSPSTPQLETTKKAK